MSDAPATKRDLEELKVDLETRLASKRDLEELEVRLVKYISEATMHAANVVMESLRAGDDKYRDVPGHHAALRSDVEAHVADASIHVAPKRRRAR
jgi:hypothetical protein